MIQRKCSKCGQLTENTLEVFAYERWCCCESCQTIFFKMVDKFFEHEDDNEKELKKSEDA